MLFFFQNSQNKGLYPNHYSEITITEVLPNGKRFMHPFMLVKNQKISGKHHIFILLDNSASMYRAINEKTVSASNPSKMAVALKRLKEVDFHHKDTVFHFYTFNSFLKKHDISSFKDFSNQIMKPVSKQSATEIFYAVTQVSKEMPVYKKKTMMIISDGENYTYKKHTGEKHPAYRGTITRNSAEKALFKANVSLYSIFAGRPAAQKDLKAMTIATGGIFFSANDNHILDETLNTITKNYQNEFALLVHTRALAREKRTFEIKTPDKFQRSKHQETGTVFVPVLFNASSEPVFFYVIPFMIFPFFCATAIKRPRRYFHKGLTPVVPKEIIPDYELKPYGNLTQIKIKGVPQKFVKHNNRDVSDSEPIHDGDVVTVYGKSYIYQNKGGQGF